MTRFKDSRGRFKREPAGYLPQGRDVSTYLGKRWAPTEEEDIVEGEILSEEPISPTGEEPFRWEKVPSKKRKPFLPRFLRRRTPEEQEEDIENLKASAKAYRQSKGSAHGAFGAPSYPSTSGVDYRDFVEPEDASLSFRKQVKVAYDRTNTEEEATAILMHFIKSLMARRYSFDQARDMVLRALREAQKEDL